jgi:UDP-N-acetylmuramoylalanine--D-glutamate ligase
MIPDAWRRHEVAVVGLGRSGVAAATYLVRRGVAVYASDAAQSADLEAAARALRSQGVTVELGRHDLLRIAAAAAVVVSPGVPPAAAPVSAARNAGVEIVAELDLGARALEDTRLAVVTGTNGKTTTTALLAHLLAESGVRAAAAGNIGRPLTDLADESPRFDWIAVEASSFQLHDAPHLAPAIGVVTNLAPDHLDRYPSVDAYYADKRLLFRNASDSSVWILNGDDPAVLELARGASGTTQRWSLQNRSEAWFDRDAGKLVCRGCVVISRRDLALLGDHNVANALAATLAATAAGCPVKDVAQGLAGFAPPRHRLEPVGTIRDVLWINDSKATNVAATTVALRAMTRPFVLILGGRPKGEPFDVLSPLLAPACRGVIAYGEAADRITLELTGTVLAERVPQFDAAVERARSMAELGDAVLLSPACASFDQFSGYEERGDRFRNLVEAMA